MGKNFKNKSVKLIITSLLCGLAFTCVNVNAMENSDSEIEQQQSQETNKENENNRKKREDIKKKIIKILLENDEEKSKEKIKEIEKELIEITDKEERDDIKQELHELMDKALIEIEETPIVINNYIEIIRSRVMDGKIDLSIKDIAYINKYIESKKEYLLDQYLEYTNETIEFFNQCIKDAIKGDINIKLKAIPDLLCYGNIDYATNIMEKIETDMKKYETYINSEENKELYYKAKDLKKRIEYEKEKAIVMKQINDHFREITTLYNSAANTLQPHLLGAALQKITEIEKIVIEKDKYVIGRLSSIRSNIENWKKTLEDEYEIIKNKIKRN